MTLDGTVIHKSGLITGGRGGLDNRSQRWEEKEVESKKQSKLIDLMAKAVQFQILTDLKRKKEQLINELQEIGKLKKKFADNDDLQSQISGIESRISYSKQDEVHELYKESNSFNLSDFKNAL